jgi:hypothetical protein
MPSSRYFSRVFPPLSALIRDKSVDLFTYREDLQNQLKRQVGVTIRDGRVVVENDKPDVVYQFCPGNKGLIHSPIIKFGSF